MAMAKINDNLDNNVNGFNNVNRNRNGTTYVNKNADINNNSKI